MNFLRGKSLVLVVGAVLSALTPSVAQAATCPVPTVGFLEGGMYGVETTEANAVAFMFQRPAPDKNPPNSVTSLNGGPFKFTITSVVPARVWKPKFHQYLAPDRFGTKPDPETLRATLVSFRSSDGKTGWLPASVFYSFGATGANRCKLPE